MKVCIDFETTGLPDWGNPDPAVQPGIVQIGAVAVDDNWEEIWAIDQLINPELPSQMWAEAAIRVHKIGPEKVVGSPTLYQFLPEFCGKVLGCDTWVGFNNPFDKTILWYQLLKYNWHQRFPWPPGDIDVMLVGKDFMSMAGKQDIKPPKLIELYQACFGEQFAKAHDALADVRATLDCARHLKEQGYL